MTINHVTKKDITERLSTVDVHNPALADLIRIRHFVNNELSASLHFADHDDCVSRRNIVCFENMCRNLEHRQFAEAWYELMDMLDFHQDNDYISINELAMLNAALLVFIMECSKRA